MEVALLKDHLDNQFIRFFWERMFDLQLNYHASDLIQKKIISPTELEAAVQRAMQISSVGGLNIRENFKPIYIDFGGYLFKDWMISELAYKLILLNGSSKNSIIAKFQISLLKEINIIAIMNDPEMNSLADA